MEESEKKRQEQLRRDNERLQKLMDQALMMEHIPAKETGNLAFMTRILVLATMPHSKPDTLVWKRRNGNFQLRMVADPEIGLPYGAQTRLLLSWITTRAIQCRGPVVILDRTMSSFMKELGIRPTGGKRGTVARFQEHAKRLFTTTISFVYDDQESGRWMEKGSRLVHQTQMWWDPVRDHDTDKPMTRVELSKPFFDELISHPVPLDLRALATLRKSPFAMDIYNWLTYRYHTLQNPTVISWESLMMQFGCSYTSARDFRKNFLKQLGKVKVLYPKANIQEIKGKGMKLWPSPTHIASIH